MWECGEADRAGEEDEASEGECVQHPASLWSLHRS